MIKIFKKTNKDEKPVRLKSLDPFSWVMVEDPDTKEVRRLKKELGLDSYLLKDALDPYEAPRIEYEKGKTYVFTNFPSQENGKVLSLPLTIILDNKNLVTVTLNQPSFWRKYILGNEFYETTHKTKLFLQIISDVVSLYGQYIHDINKQVRKIIAQPGKITNKDILDFVISEETLNTFINDLEPTRISLKSLFGNKYIRLDNEEEKFLEDILLSTEQLIDLAKSNTKSIVNIRGAYSTVITNNLNQAMKMLTAITVILTIPTIISSIYGMNVNLPLSNSPWIFAVIIAIILALSGLLIAVFKKIDWF